jgi:cellobiose phosphorylase
VAVEKILGLQRRKGYWVIDPCIPSDWPGFRLTVRDRDTVYRIEVENPSAVSSGVTSVRLDGRVLPDQRLPQLRDGRQHDVQVCLGAERRATEAAAAR